MCHRRASHEHASHRCASMDVPLIGVHLMDVPLVGVYFIGLPSYRCVCHGRPISIVAITGIAVKMVERTYKIR
jgi:hypothetical protein